MSFAMMIPAGARFSIALGDTVLHCVSYPKTKSRSLILLGATMAALLLYG